MDTKAKTIQIFLPDGSPRSIRIAEITNRTVQAILIPRNKLKEADARNEIKNVGVYFLFDELELTAKPSVYVGEAEDCYDRIKQHNQKKEFWNTAVVIVSRTGSFTKSHVKYLEWFCHNKIAEINRFSLENTVTPTKSFVTESMEADLLDSFDTIRILLSTLGFPLFEEIAKLDKRDIFYCRGKDAYAEGEFIDDGFVVFKGSKANQTETKTVGSWIVNMRQKLIDTGVLKQEGNVYVFTADHVFSSPSGAAGVVLARNANGWVEWKDKDGKTSDEIKRR